MPTDSRNVRSAGRTGSDRRRAKATRLTDCVEEVRVEPVAHGGRLRAPQQRARTGLGDVHPELAIGLELLLVEELIEGRFGAESRDAALDSA
jgi:hypothetical protein